VSHDVQSIAITVTFTEELGQVTEAEVQLIESVVDEVIQAMLLSQEEEGVRS
jgi:hypothetical protein